MYGTQKAESIDVFPDKPTFKEGLPYGSVWTDGTVRLEKVDSGRTAEWQKCVPNTACCEAYAHITVDWATWIVTQEGVHRELHTLNNFKELNLISDSEPVIWSHYTKGYGQRY